MKSVVAIRHVHFEDLGAFTPALLAAGYDIRYKDAGIDALGPTDIGDPELLVILGGPVGAYQDATYPFLKEELKLLEKRLAADRPTLGICLGAQLMARALGAKVYPGRIREIGWGAVELSESGRKSCLHELLGIAMLHWHGDTFDLPLHSTRLASTSAYRNQAFSHGQHALALQFHAEVPQGAMERWFIGHASEIASTPKISVESLRTETARRAPHAAEAGARMLAKWLTHLETDTL